MTAFTATATTTTALAFWIAAVVVVRAWLTLGAVLQVTLIIGLYRIACFGAWALWLTRCLHTPAYLSACGSVDCLRALSALLPAVTFVTTVATTTARITTTLASGVITLLCTSGATITLIA